MNDLAVKKAAISKKKCSRLSLLLSNSSDEKLVRRIFSDEFKISSTVEAFKSGQFDLLITDVSRFREFAILFKKVKHQSFPVVLPILLLIKNRPLSSEISEYAEFVDDILYMPTSPELLRSRIKLLLQTRSYSKKLEEEKRKYQLLAENSTDMISTHRPNGEYEYVSPSSRIILGYTPKELIGRNAFDFIHEDDHEAISVSREYTLKTNEPSKVEFRKRTKSGEYKWVESILKTLESFEDPGTVQIQAATRDISDRKCYEEKLKKEVLLRDASLDALPNIFFMVDSELNFVRWNKNLEESLGYSKQDILNMSPFDFFEEKNHEKVKCQIREVFVAGEAELEAEFVTKEGELILHRISGRLFTEDDKKYIIGTCVDISRDHKMMNELKASNKEKQVLLLEIHHRVKNNLAVISGMLQLQAMESDDPVLGEKLTDSQMRVQSIASVHELLYQSESFSHLNMENYLKNLVRKIKEANKLEKDILLVEDISPVVLNINQAIPCSLIANELITNAYKHAFKGQKGGKVAIKLTEENEGDVQLIVEDNGDGLPEDVDFVEPKSMGLQLIHIMKGQLKGTLDISKSENGGSRFCLRFRKQDTKGSANGHL